jgi:hypothetical protein
MKRFGTTIAMCLIALLCSMSYAGESNEPNIPLPNTPGLTVWGNMDNSLERLIGLRVGYETDFSVEVGGTALWEVGDDWDDTPDRYGLYLCYWIDELATVIDSDGYSGYGDLLQLLVAKPYAVVEGLYVRDDANSDNDDMVLGIGAGTAFFAKNDLKRRVALTVEYVTIESYEHKFKLGFRLKF